MIGLSNKKLDRLNVNIGRESLLQLDQFWRAWLKRIVDKSVFLNRPMWYPYLGFLEVVLNQLVLVARSTPTREPFLLLANASP